MNSASAEICNVSFAATTNQISLWSHASIHERVLDTRDKIKQIFEKDELGENKSKKKVADIR